MNLKETQQSQGKKKQSVECEEGPPIPWDPNLWLNSHHRRGAQDWVNKDHLKEKKNYQNNKDHHEK